MPKTKISALPPRVEISCAMALDGKLSYRGRLCALSGKPDWARVYGMRAKFDAILVGSNTIIIDNPSLSSHGFGADPVKVVLDSMLSVPASSRIFEHGTVVMVHSGRAQAGSKLAISKASGAKVIFCQVRGNEKLDPEKALAALRRLGIKSVLVEGGASTMRSFLESGLSSRMHVFVAPMVFGGTDSQTTTISNGRPFPVPAYFNFESVELCGYGFVLHLLKRHPNASPIKSNFRPQWDSRLNTVRTFPATPKSSAKSKNRIPKVTISCAMTIDGKIAYSHGNLVLSDRLDWERTFRDRAASDAVLVGASSSSIVPHPYGSYGFGPEPLKVILDPHLRTPPNARIFENSNSVIFHAAAASKSRLEKFRAMQGVSLVRMQRRRFSPKKILAILGRLGVKTVLVEGGGRTINSFLREGSFDKIRIFISPQVISGDDSTSISLAQGKAFKKPVKLRLARVQLQGVGALAEFERKR
ncbi:MAG TPA: dihydrofolate reductase family protein [Candidatus Micrarchaeota archaeon]|nr:dihydrofolate reductase family protein [Candidatus Micrarchaeota archaeon]